LGLSAAIALLALAAALGLALSSEVDAPEHEAYARTLRTALELDARLDEEIANARLGVVTHYDGLVRVRDQLAVTQSRLREIPVHVREASRSELTTALTRYREALDEKLALVERFKTEQAVLRNSVRALPHNAERLLSEVGEEQASLRLAIDSILERALLVVIAPGPERTRLARCALTNLGGPGGESGECDGTEAIQVPPELAHDVDRVVTHARTIVDRHEAVDRLIATVVELPVSERADALLETYAAAHLAAVTAVRNRWLAAFAAALAFLFFGASFIITRQRESASDLRDTKAKLEEALGALEVERDREAELAALKSRFVSMTTHEFRTPLSVILSSAELLQAYGNKWDDEKRAKHLVRIQDATKTMSRMLDDVLLIGRAEAGMLELKPAPLNLATFSETVLDEVRAAMGPEREVEFSPSCRSDEVLLDEKLLRHVLTNLLSNAFKYSPGDSTVHFEVSCDQEAASFEIRDEGIGIPPEEQARLFEAFHRCSNADTIPGTGLGLAVVKKSIEVHNGAIDVDSRVGEGTRFSVRIPLSEGAA
jgi:signal transduction histidine kinase